MKKILVVRADTNDGDYVTQESKITDSQIEKLKPVIKELKKKKGYHNWITGDLANDGESPEEMYEGKLTEAQISMMEDFTPFGENGTHTIESIRVLHVTKEETLL